MRVDILEFIEASNRAATPGELSTAFERAIAGLGYDRFMYSMLTPDSVHEWHKAPAIMRNYPEDWMSHYVANDYVVLDPVRRCAFRTQRPFRWIDLPSFFNLSALERKIMHECDEAGLHAGVGIPFHGPFGEVAGVGVASTTKKEEPNSATVATLGVIAYQFHNVHLGLALKDEVRPGIRLTRREKEVLTWCAQGKSNWAIGEILDLSEATVKFHVANSIQKLGADSKITAVLKAIRLGLIAP